MSNGGWGLTKFWHLRTSEASTCLWTGDFTVLLKFLLKILLDCVFRKSFYWSANVHYKWMNMQSRLWCHLPAFSACISSFPFKSPFFSLHAVSDKKLNREYTAEGLILASFFDYILCEQLAKVNIHITGHMKLREIALTVD